MKLTIDMQNQTSFKIVEQNTGKNGWVSEQLYKDNFICICQRNYPEFKIYGDDDKPTLYLRGNNPVYNDRTIYCGRYIYTILCTLKKVFDEFKILNCDKFILEK